MKVDCRLERWLIVLGVLLSATGCSDLAQPTPAAPVPTPAPKSTKTPRPTPTPKLVVAFQGVAKKLGPLQPNALDKPYSVQINVTDIMRAEGTEGASHSAEKYLLLKIGVQNLGPGTLYSLSNRDFYIRDGDGTVQPASDSRAGLNCNFRIVDLVANDFARGCLAFQQPGTEDFEFIYAPFHLEGLKEGRYLTFRLKQ